MRGITPALLLSVALGLVGCERTSDNGDHAPRAGTPSEAHQGHAHATTTVAEDDHHGGAAIELGTAEIAGMRVRASRDAGDIAPSGDTVIDVWINDGVGPAPVVRFWIGAEDAKGAIKTKAEVRNGNWHGHAEAPDPLTDGARLWVEIEDKDGATHVVSFELKG